MSPHEGSTEGGTLVTVSGSGFGTNVSDIEVDVDGIPCHVMTHNMTHIQCWTGRPRDDDLSVADGDGGYSVTDSGHRFRGNVHSHTVIHPFFHTSILSQCLPHLDRHLHFLYAHTHSHSVILSFSHSPTHSFSILSFSHTLIFPFCHTLIHSGSRGVSYRTYHGGTIRNLDTLHSHGNYPDNPNAHGIYPSYITEDDRK